MNKCAHGRSDCEECLKEASDRRAAQGFLAALSATLNPGAGSLDGAIATAGELLDGLEAKGFAFWKDL